MPCLASHRVWQGSCGMQHPAACMHTPTLCPSCVQASKPARLVLASDPDREGEAIAWHVLEELRVRLSSGCLLGVPPFISVVVAMAWHMLELQEPLPSTVFQAVLPLDMTAMTIAWHMLEGLRVYACIN
jgi:Toprim domain